MQNLISKAKNLKLLSPVGDWASLRTAVEADTDEIYFGIKNFNMRNTATRNFLISDMPKIVKYCEKKSVKTYLTLNTVMYDLDLTKMMKIIEKAKESNCTGIIASDFAVIEYARKINIPVCISTQLSVSNIQAVKFFSKYADRIILARELNLESIKKIVEKIKKEDIRGPSGDLIEIEIFGHGALCVGISGRCNMSLYCYGSSANRGECTQVCRRKYRVIDMETGKELIIQNKYIMSPKDLCTIGILPEIIDSGISVLKLEGRGRPPEYVDTVVRSYKRGINAVVENSFNSGLVKELNKELNIVFNRGLSTGMYLGRDINEWAHGPGNQSKQKRMFVGKVINFFKKTNIALIKIQGNVKLNQGDSCLIIGDSTGLIKLTLNEMMADEKIVKSVKQNDEFTVKVSKVVRKNDQVYKLE